MVHNSMETMVVGWQAGGMGVKKEGMGVIVLWEMKAMRDSAPKLGEGQVLKGTLR